MSHNLWVQIEHYVNENRSKTAALVGIIVSTDVKVVQTKYVRKCLYWVQAIRTMFLSLFVLMVRQIIIWISNLVQIQLFIGHVQLLWMENSGFLVVPNVRFVIIYSFNQTVSIRLFISVEQNHWLSVDFTRRAWFRFRLWGL